MAQKRDLAINIAAHMSENLQYGQLKASLGSESVPLPLLPRLPGVKRKHLQHQQPFSFIRNIS